MAVQIIDSIRGGKLYKSIFGTTPELGTRCTVIEGETDPELELEIKNGPRKVVMIFDDNLDGNIVDIFTTYGRAPMLPNGKVQVETIKDTTVRTITSDKGFFVQAYGLGNIISILNGWFKLFLGHHDKGIIDTTATPPALIVLTPEQEQEPPTFGVPPIPVVEPDEDEDTPNP